MATCPNCGASSRTDPTFSVEEVLISKPPGTFSIAGVQTKVVATQTLRLSHSCGWSILGYIDDESFVGDPATSTTGATS